MFKKLCSLAILLSLLFMGNPVSGESKKEDVVEKEKLSPLNTYKDNYWIFGDLEDQAYVQLSFKYSVFKNYHTGVFLGYSQYIDWELYESSSPMKDINYSPELFVKSKYFFDFLDYIQFSPYQHRSNGRASQGSRGIDRAYVETQWSTGYDLTAGVNLKLFIYYSQEKCDYAGYTKYYESDFFVTLGNGNRTKEELHLRLSGFNKGWQEIGFMTRKLWFMNSRIYIQFRHGYLHNMLEWDKKETRLRAGLLFK